MKTATHNGQVCTFDEEAHTYTVNGNRLISGTTFIKQFFPVFDGPKIAGEIADRKGTTQEALLQEWKEKGERASRKGNMVHTYAEYMFGDDDLAPYSIEDDEIGNVTVQLLMACDTLREKWFKPIEAEKIIFSTTLGIAGTVDLLLWSPSGEVVILDWKTNEKLTLDNPFQSGLPPIGHLEDSKLNHYALQLSLYQYILISEGYFPTDDKYQRMIVHLTETSSTPYSCRYLKSEIESMLI